MAMAVSLHSTASCFLKSKKTCVSVRQPAHVCMTKTFLGLKDLSASRLTAKAPPVDFVRKTGTNSRAVITRMCLGVPLVYYQLPGRQGYEWIDLWNAFYRQRIIFVGEYIEEDFSNQVLATMLYLDTIDSEDPENLGNPDKIYLYLNCPGGDVTPTLCLYDTMRSLRSAVGTRCMSYAFNLAGFILAAGEKGNRAAMPLATVELQSPAGAARGQASGILNEANELLRVRSYLFGELAKQTGQPLEKIYEDLKDRKFFTAEKALEYGIIDRIMKPQGSELAVKEDEDEFEED